MTRTGAHRHCPVCGAALWAPASPPFAAARCPRWGAELWAVVFSSGPCFFVRQPGQSLADFVTALAEAYLGPEAGDGPPALASMDSLDAVELIMELEVAARK